MPASRETKPRTRDAGTRSGAAGLEPVLQALESLRAEFHAVRQELAALREHIAPRDGAEAGAERPSPIPAKSPPKSGCPSDAGIPSPADVEARASSVMARIVGEIAPAPAFDADQFRADFELALANPDRVDWEEPGQGDPEPEESLDPSVEEELLAGLYERFPELPDAIEAFNRAGEGELPSCPRSEPIVSDEEAEALAEGMSFLLAPPNRDAGEDGAESGAELRSTTDPSGEARGVPASMSPETGGRRVLPEDFGSDAPDPSSGEGDGREPSSAAEVESPGPERAGGALVQATDEGGPAGSPPPGEEPAASPTPTGVVSADEIERMLGLRQDPIQAAEPTPHERSEGETAASPSEPVEGATDAGEDQPEPSADPAPTSPATLLAPTFEAVATVSGCKAAAALAIPLAIEGGRLLCAAAEPFDREALAELEQSAGMPLEIRPAPAGAVVAALREWYAGEKDPRYRVADVPSPAGLFSAVFPRRSA